jgi:PIN domain nuclease of toxin-antitoxin system
MREAALTTEVAIAILHTQLSHHDPADLFLVATAKVLDLTLVTADVRLLEEPGLSTLANR